MELNKLNEELTEYVAELEEPQWDEVEEECKPYAVFIIKNEDGYYILFEKSEYDTLEDAQFAYDELMVEKENQIGVFEDPRYGVILAECDNGEYFNVDGGYPVYWDEEE